MKQVNLRPHQIDAVRRLHNGSILTGGVGTGKSRVAMQYYIEREAPKDVYIITTAKKRDSFDWEAEAVLHGVTSKDSMPGRGSITVDSWNNIGKYIDVEGAFFVFDEQRLVGSGAWVKGFRAIAKKNNWILLSATPGDTWLDYIPVFVANGFYKNKTEFLRDHVVYSRFSKFPKVEKYIAVNRLVKHRNALLVDMPYERHTNRIMHFLEVAHDETLYEKVVKKRWHVFENRPLRDVAELFSVMRKVANSDASRLATVRSLMKDHPKLIVFYNFDYELELLRGLAESPSTNTRSTALTTSQSSIQQEPITQRKPGTSSRPSSNSQTQPRSEFADVSQSLTPTATVTQCPIRDCPDCAIGSQSMSSSASSSGTSRRMSETDSSVSTQSGISSHTRPTSESLIGSGKVTATGNATSLVAATSTAATGSFPSVSTAEWSSRSPVGSTRLSDKSQASVKTSTDSGSTTHYTPTTGNTTVQSSVESDSSTSYSGVPVAEWNGHKHEAIPKTDRWVYLVQYTAGAEGWNCIETDAVCFYSLNYSYRIFEQCQGRIDRLNTPFVDLHYYILRSKATIDQMIWRALRVKKRFNEPKTEEALSSRFKGV